MVQANLVAIAINCVKMSFFICSSCAVEMIICVSQMNQDAHAMQGEWLCQRPLATIKINADHMCHAAKTAT